MPELPSLKKFVKFTKVNSALREVSGVVTAEQPDKDMEVCDYEKSKPFYQALISEMTKATDGENCMPLREMHQLSAVGKGIGFNFNDQDKEIEMTFKVVDNDAWEKVEKRVYTGFSQGGRKVGNQTPDPVFKGCMRYTANPSEVSLVDNPCLPDAHFAYVKADGSIEMRKFLKTEVPETHSRIVALEEQVSLLKGAQAAPITATIIVAEDKTEKTKRVAGKELPASSFAYVPDLEKTDTWQFPIHEARYIRQSLAKMALAPEKEKAKVRTKVVTAARKAGIDVMAENDKVAAMRVAMRKATRVYINKNYDKIVSPRLRDLDTDMGKLAKGMWEVSRMACILEDLACLVFAVCCEQEWELDEESALPEMLSENVSAVTESLIAMVDEETRELLAQVKAHVK